MEKEVELLRLKIEVAQRKAQTFEQLVVVTEYKRLLEEIGGYMQTIMKIEEEERQNERETMVKNDAFGSVPDPKHRIG
jgi:hypothetical protein